MQDSKSHVFGQEVKALQHVKHILQSEDSPDVLKKEFELLADNYEKLLGDARVITKISDRLQNKLNDANEQLNERNEQLNETIEELNRTNEVLQQTINELIKARVSKKATTIVFMAAIVLFVVSEVFLEPIVDAYFPKDFTINIVIKGSIALLLKPIDYLVERYLLGSAMRKTRRQQTQSPQVSI